MWLPTKEMINTGTRYAMAMAGPVIVVLGLQSKGFTLDQAKAAIQALGDTVTTIVTLIGTLAAIYATAKGINSSAPSNQVKAAAVVLQDNSKPEQQAQSARLMADAVRDVGATGSALAAFEAKTALLDAVASQREVVGNISVTDPALASATISSQVKATT